MGELPLDAELLPIEYRCMLDLIIFDMKSIRTLENLLLPESHDV
jgi:hypothetical protein